MSRDTKYNLTRYGIMFLCGAGLAGLLGFWGLIPCVILGWNWRKLEAIIVNGPDDEDLR